VIRMFPVLFVLACTPAAPEPEGFLGGEAVTALGASSDVAIIDEAGLHVVFQRVDYRPDTARRAMDFDVRFVVLDGPPGETSGTVAIGGGQYTCAITEEVVECSDGLADTVTLPRVDLPKLPE